MAAPHQPIPETTQVHVDRLVGARLGDVEVGAKVCEGRFGTLYRARQATTELTLEVLRAGVVGDEQEVRAANAIKCAGIADVVAFGHVPDGRHYRVMELLDGESLEQRRERGKLPAPEVARVLGQVAEVLQAAHAWAMPHGNLGPSSVFVVRGAVKLIDVGLSKHRASLEGDLKALGALGFTLLTGTEHEAAPPAPVKPEVFDRVLRALLEGRVKDATAAKRELAMVVSALDEAPAGSRAWVGVVALLTVLAAGAALFFSTRAPAPDPAVTEPEELVLDEGPDPEPQPTDATPTEAPTAATPTDATSTAPTTEATPTSEATTAPTTRPSAPRPAARVVPSAARLMEEISRLEARFRKQVKAGDDLDQALFVLNKQRLRLTGSPTEQDRRDVARQLAGWKRSYLRR